MKYHFSTAQSNPSRRPASSNRQSPSLFLSLNCRIRTAPRAAPVHLGVRRRSPAVPLDLSLSASSGAQSPVVPIPLGCFLLGVRRRSPPSISLSASSGAQSPVVPVPVGGRPPPSSGVPFRLKKQVLSLSLSGWICC